MAETICFAGKRVHGTDSFNGGCFCVIEGQIITERERHFHVACTGENYHMCPTWREHKERNWKDRESDVAKARHEAIERHYGHDPIADAVLAGEAPIEAMLEE